MKNRTVFLISILLVLSLLFSSCGGESNTNEETEDSTRRENITGEYTGFKAENVGFYIYRPYVHINWGYRYGPSILVNDDGSLDAYFSAPGYLGQADYILYKHSDDNGASWSEEKSVLQPTPGSPDLFSCCDPGVIFLNGYYYIGYTSTVDATGGGLDNYGFVARSRNPDGPFEKWNGKGWGGKPCAIVENSGSHSDWGAGELSFTVKDDVLYVYYTQRSVSGHYMMSCVADATDENWPLTVKDFRESIEMQNQESGVDVKYDPELDKFLAVAVVNSFTADCSLNFYLSDDGRTFTENCVLYENIHKYAHNVGLVYNRDGTVNVDSFYVAYSFGEEWGRWATLMVPVTSYDSDCLVPQGDTYSGGIEPVAIEQEAAQIAVTTDPHHLKLIKGNNKAVSVVGIREDYTSFPIECDGNVQFTGYDADVIEFGDNGIVTGKSIGSTYVTVKYKNYLCDLLVSVYKEGTDTETVKTQYGD